MRGVVTFVLFCVLSTQALAAGAQYRLQPGDKLSITVWQDDKLNRQIIVRPDGRISFPLAGHMRAAGLSAERLEGTLKARLRRFYKDDIDVSIMVTQVVPKTIYVTGEVARPGAITIVKPTTVLQAIATAGGLGQFASKSRIKIRRKVKGEDVAIPFSYRDAVAGRNSGDNIYLRNNDVIVVPERGLFGGLFD